MSQKWVPVGILVLIAALLILQAIFWKPIGAWQAGRVRRYPRFIRWFYDIFPPDSEFASRAALLAAIFGGFVCLVFALIIALYAQPISR